MNQWGFRCFHCRKRLAIATHGLCSCCRQALKPDEYCYCGHCGMPLAENANSCGKCLREEPKWHRIVQIFDYNAPLADWIHRFKFQQQFYLDQMLARLLLLAVYQARRTHQLTLPEVIMPVPLHWQRHWQRGYNQSTLIARYLSAWLNIPLECEALVRQRATSSQRELSAKDRRLNLKNAFCYTPSKPYRRVAIVDDVVTTGSTLNAISLELLKQGVQEIQVWTLARA